MDNLDAAPHWYTAEDRIVIPKDAEYIRAAAIPDLPEVKALVEAAKNAIVAMQEARSVIVSKREHQVLADAVHATRAALAAFDAKP